MRISILLNALSYKIISHQYQAKISDGVLHLNYSDHLTHLLYYSNKSSNRNNPRLQSFVSLDHEIQIEMPKSCMPNGDNGYIYANIGYFIYREHMMMMMNHIASESRHISCIMTSIRNWMDIYDIDENDLAMATAYKNWQRFENKYIKEREKHIKQLRVKTTNKITSYKQAHKIAGRIAMQHIDLFKNNDGNFNNRLYRRMLFHLLKTQAYWNVSTIKQKFGYKRSGHIYDRITDFDMFLMRNKEFKQKYLNICTQFRP